MANYDLTISTGSGFTKRFQIKKSDGTIFNLTGYSASMQIIKNPGEFSTTVFTTTGGQLINGGATGILTLTLSVAEVNALDGNFFKVEIKDVLNVETEVITGNLFLLTEGKTELEYLIPMVRLRIGDTNPASYRYMDEWVKMSLIAAIESLQLWWRGRYNVNRDGIVTRDEDYLYFETPVSEGVIEQKDEYIVVLMAAYLLLSGSLENSAYNVQSWRDNEIAFSNLEGGRMRGDNVTRLWNELLMYMTPPTKRLARPKKGSLWGYKGNIYEHGDTF